MFLRISYPFKLFMLILIHFILTIDLKSAPHINEHFQFIQPDNSLVDVVVNGDEYYQRVESPEGYTLIRNEDGWISYAKLSSDSSKLIPAELYDGSKRTFRGAKHLELSRKTIGKLRQKKIEQLELAEQKERASNRYSIQVGEKLGLTMLVDFSDEQFTLTKDQIDTAINQYVKEYFYNISSGKLIFKNEIVGIYRAKHPKSYYDSESSPKKIELLAEALNWLDKNDFDFSKITTIDKNSKIMASVNLIYAGKPKNGWAKGLWPHKGSYSWDSKSGYGIKEYQMSKEPKEIDRVSTFCHENGHLLLGYPDLYPYDGGPRYVPPNFCLMSGAGSGPINPYFRFKSGWLEYEDITDVKNGTFETKANSVTSAHIYKNSKNNAEAFIIEAIQPIGIYEKWQKKYPEGGLLVWKLDTDGSNKSGNSHKPLLEVAGYIKDSITTLFISNRPDDAFTSQTEPSAIWPSGNPSDLKIKNVSKVSSVMTFDIGKGDKTISVIDSKKEPNIKNSKIKDRLYLTLKNSCKFSVVLYSLDGKQVNQKFGEKRWEYMIFQKC